MLSAASAFPKRGDARFTASVLPQHHDGLIEPGHVFDRVVGLDEVPDGYRAMNERESIKVMVKP